MIPVTAPAVAQPTSRGRRRWRWSSRLMADPSPAILAHLTALYGEDVGRATFERLRALLNRYHSLPSPAGRGYGNEGKLSERDSILITYGDQVQSPGMPPLRVLADFCHKHLPGVVSGIHLLPFYPWTSDDGFSVKNYHALYPALGFFY